LRMQAFYKSVRLNKGGIGSQMPLYFQVCQTEHTVTIWYMADKTPATHLR